VVKIRRKMSSGERKAKLAEAVQEVVGKNVELAEVEQGHIGKARSRPPTRAAEKIVYRTKITKT